MPLTTNVVLANPAKPKRILRALMYPVDLAITPPYTGGVAGGINPGELVYVSAAGKLASLDTPGSTNANAAKCVGIADDQYPVRYGAGITGSSVPPGDAMIPFLKVLESCDALMQTTAAETYHVGDKVYLGADSRTISTVATGTSVGYVIGDQRQTSGISVAQPILTPVTGAAGVLIYIRIQPALAP